MNLKRILSILLLSCLAFSGSHYQFYSNTSLHSNVSVRSASAEPMAARYIRVLIEGGTASGGGGFNGILDISELQVMANGVNVAAGRTAYAASIYGPCFPDLAFDGSTTTYTNWYATDLGTGYAYPLSNQWLVVDLGTTYDNIDTIVFRTDLWLYPAGGYSPITDYTVQYASGNYNWITFEGGVVRGGADATRTDTLAVSSGQSNGSSSGEAAGARYIRVLIEGGTASGGGGFNGILDISELQVIVNGTNVAAGRTAYAASYYGPCYPNLAFDGSTTTYTNWYATDQGTGYAYPLSNQWLVVDLGTTYDNIDTIVFRTDLWLYPAGGYSPITDYTVQYSADNANWNTFPGGVVRGGADATRTDTLSIGWHRIM